MSNPILEYLEKLRQQRAHDRDAYTTPPEPPDHKAQQRDYHLRWKPSQLKPLPPPISVEEVRSEMRAQIHEYAQTDDYKGELLLVRVPPGTGKTTIAVNAAQDLPGRVLYAAPRHDFFADVCGVRGMSLSAWYEWQPIQKQDTEGRYEMCRYAEAMLSWLNRGYRGVDLCRQVCVYDKHMTVCPYRMQAQRKEKIIFGMHNHLITGMSISDYTIGFCDEMPISAFLNRKRVPASEIRVPGAVGAIGALFETLHSIAHSNHGVVYGRTLMELLGGVLDRAYAEIDAGEDVLQAVPNLYAPEEVHNVPYWYVYDLLRLLSPEYECYKNDWAGWISRVRVNKDGILLLNRYDAKDCWKGDPEGLPKKLVCLDATGSPEMYRRLFDRPVVEYAPAVERPGKVFQIVGRLNGTGTVLGKTMDDKSRLTKSGRQMVKAAHLIAEQYTGRVAVVTFKNAEREAQAVFGKANVRHFGGLRGTNDLESAEALIVCGGYCPPMSAMFDLAAALNPDRMEPFYDGETPPWSTKEREYRMREPEGLAPWRSVSGFWTDPDLAVLLNEYRRSEIVQAMHRVRPILKASDVWLLTSIPTGEPLDEIYETLSDVEFTPSRKSVTRTTKKGRVYEAWEGITWECWLQLYQWLDLKWDEKVLYLTKEELATTANVTPGTVSSQKWFDYLDEFYRDREKRWVKDHKRLSVMGRATWILVPVEG